jgi:putative transposase
MNYPSDCSDEQWDLIKEWFDTADYGHTRKHPRQQLTNAVFYVIETGCQWRQLPSDFPPWKTVYSFYRCARDRGVWERVMDSLVKKSPISDGRNLTPRAIVR